MSANSFGNLFRIITFGESHGPAMGVVIDGCPSGVVFDKKLLLKELSRRRPGNGKKNVSQRNEPDLPAVLSGVFKNKTLGTPISILFFNEDFRSQDYFGISRNPRPGHADDVWKEKFKHVDPRGGGRASGRETVSRVAAGAVARMVLKKISPKTKINGYIKEIGPYQLALKKPIDEKMHRKLRQLQAEGDSWGGVVEVVVKNPGFGLGQPVFHKLKADLACACLSIGATVGFELGLGFSSARQRGSEFHSERGGQYGGIRGGISTGEDLILRVAFKPTSSIFDIAKKGRHDPCIVIRALPVVEAMVALSLGGSSFVEKIGSFIKHLQVRNWNSKRCMQIKLVLDIGQGL